MSKSKKRKVESSRDSNKWLERFKHPTKKAITTKITFKKTYMNQIPNKKLVTETVKMAIMKTFFYRERWGNKMAETPSTSIER